MRDDLLFHITTQEHWKEFQKDGSYVPESLDTEGFIHCSSGSQLEDTANRLFGDEDEILLLVIDASMIRDDVKYEDDDDIGEKFPHIYGAISVNAVIDKIKVKAEKNGKFNIAFTSDS
ncbi:MAG: DUF952 domain-containing protein [Fodinibius sp.]|nr:DUF952 domain-containing protein [Fodinibius sp.]